MLLALPSALLMVDADGVIRLANAEAASVLKRTTDELRGMPIEHVIAPLPGMIELTQGHGNSSLEYERTDGRRGRLGFTLSPVFLGAEPGGTILYSMIFRDISRESSIASERDRLLRLASMGAAAPTIIHEVKNSLTSIMMGLELLEDRVEEPNVADSVRTLLAEARKVAHTVQGFGAVGRDLKTLRPFDLELMLVDAIDVLRIPAEAAGVTLCCDDASLPPVRIEPSVLHAILSNLVTNAIYACSPGDRIDVSAKVEGDRFVLSITDTGRGMSPDVVERCTDLFFSTRQGGNGIGLALCREAILAANGVLDIDSVPGRGTRMTIVVPAAIDLDDHDTVTHIEIRS